MSHLAPGVEKAILTGYTRPGGGDMIVDYSTARPVILDLKEAGVTAVGRYLGWDSVPSYPSIGKNLEKEEAAELLAASINIFLVFEYLADAAARGSIQGHNDGVLALNQLGDLGAPPDMTVYFSADFDMPDYNPGIPDVVSNASAKLGPVADYFRAIQSMKMPYVVGVYGGFSACRRLLDARLVTAAWQSMRWSEGMREDRALLTNTGRKIRVPGQVLDLKVNENIPHTVDFGQWPRPVIEII